MRYLKVGDIILIKEGHDIYTKYPLMWGLFDSPFTWELAERDVTVRDSFNYLIGKYLVVNTCQEGGGVGHGSHDSFPNGHRVYCKRLFKKSHQKEHEVIHTCDINFYQSGAFTAMIRPDDIDVVGEAEVKTTTTYKLPEEK